MDDDFPKPKNFAVWAAVFEGGLVFVALGLGWLFGIKPLESFHWNMAGLGIGVVAALLPLMLLWMCVKCPILPCRVLVELFDEFLLPLFRECNVLEMAVIAILAGIGEEMIFRGIVQAGLDGWISTPMGKWVAIIDAAILFGVLHAITPAYALYAALIGFYMGWLWMRTDNLLVPITVHAVYDFVALVYMVKLRKPLVPSHWDK